MTAGIGNGYLREMKLGLSSFGWRVGFQYIYFLYVISSQLLGLKSANLSFTCCVRTKIKGGQNQPQAANRVARNNIKENWIMIRQIQATVTSFKTKFPSLFLCVRPKEIKTIIFITILSELCRLQRQFHLTQKISLVFHLLAHTFIIIVGINIATLVVLKR